MDTFIIACILTFIILSAEGVDRLFYRKKEKEEECTIFYDDHIDNSQYFKELEEIYNYVNSHNYDKFLSSALKNTIDKGYKLFETKKEDPYIMEDFQKEALNKHYVITLDETIAYVEEHFDNLYFHLIELSILIKKVFKVTPIMYLYVDYEYVHWKTLTIGIPLKDFHGDKSKMESKLSHYIFENFLVHKPSFFKTAISINIDYI